MTEEVKPTFTWKQKKNALWRQLRSHKSVLIVLGIAEIATALGNGIIPLVTGRFFDALITPHSVTVGFIGLVPSWEALFASWVVVQLATNALSWGIDRKQRRLTTELEAGTQARAFAHLLTLPISYHKSHRAGETTSVVDRSGWMLGSMVNTILSVAPQLLTVLIGVAISFSIRPSLALVLLAGAGVYLVVMIRTLPATSGRQEQAYAMWKRAFGDASDAYTNIQTVKQAGAEEYESKHIRASYFEKAIPMWYRMELLWSTLNFSQRVIVTVTQGAIFLFSVVLIAHGQLTIGGLIAFNAYAGMIIGPFVTIGSQWQTVQNALTTLVHLDEIFKTVPEKYVPEGAIALPDVRGDVSFDDVRFTYGEGQPEVLKGITFNAKAGEIVAFVGETGVGKSTAAELISGYYFANEGKVLVDGHDIKAVNLRDLRSRIAIVPQEVVLFNSSISDNIRYGRPEATDEEVKRAAESAFADGFIEKFPQKYEQEVGERGIKLSVGQKQRVAIARAMLRDPRILILDEPTSALDPETESYITKSLEKLMEGRTTFIIAHRLSTVRKADRIIVLEDGKIAEEGSHAELLKNEGKYSRLYNFHIGLHE